MSFSVVFNILHSSGKGRGGEGVSTFSKLMEMGRRGLKIFARKGGLGKMGGLSRNVGLLYYIEVLLEIPHDEA